MKKYISELYTPTENVIDTSDQRFSPKSLNSHFNIPEHLRKMAVDETEIPNPFLTPTDWDGLGGGFEVKPEFFESVYFSEDGLLWILNYLQNIQETQQGTDLEEIGRNDDFWMVDDEKENMTMDHDEYDWELYNQRYFILNCLEQVETNKETVDKFIDFLQRDYKSHVYTYKIANVLSLADLNYSLEKVSELIE